MSVIADRKYASFAEFYSDYLAEHSNRISRELHFAGSTLALICLGMLLLTMNPWWMVGAVITGYGLAWFGHYVYDEYATTTFHHPLYSLMGNWLMYWQMLTGQTSFSD
jgi:hypothetical protein